MSRSKRGAVESGPSSTSARRCFRSVVFALAFLWPLAAHSEPVEGPEINPFACQGQAESLENDRSIAEMRWELGKRLDPLFQPSDPPTVRAIKLCVIGEMKKRVGDAGAVDYYLRAISENPQEPGFEMFAAKYYAGARGARGQVADLAEKHYYRALEKLDALRAQGRFRDFHAVVEDHVRKGLLVLYQQDGMPLLPWKAYPQHPSGYLAPGVSVASQDSIGFDTRGGPGANETGGFMAEAGLFVIRSRDNLVPEQRIQENLKIARFDIARNPLRLRSDNQLRLRHAFLGSLDFVYGVLTAKNAAITAFARPSERVVPPGGPPILNDVDVREIGGAYERVIGLYPLFDLKVAGGARRVRRVGTVEGFPDCAQDFNVYEVRPTLSRFVSSDKLTVGGVWVLMDMPPVNCAGGPTPDQATSVRGRRIAAATFEYAFYSPLLLPRLDLVSLHPYRTPTRGLYLYGGYVNDNEVFGDHRTINETYYGGARLEGPGPFDIGVTESYYVASGTQLNPTTRVEDPSLDLAGKTLRTSLVFATRLLNPDATPGVPPAWGPLALHSVNWVFPASFDKVTAGRDDFENFRVGTQLWWQLFGTGFGGPAFLFTLNYEYQYFYKIPKSVHNAGITIRLGWRDL
jgi:hypothetical protein